MQGEQREHVGELAFAPDERRRLRRQVRLVEALQRRKVVLAELVEALRRCEVLEPVQAQVAQAICAGEIASCLRQKDLAAVTGSGDARRTMHIDPDVTLVRFGRLARMQSHSHSDRSVGQRFPRRRRCRQRIGRLRERDEARVPLRPHLDAPVACERLA
jgi:hypothetical protein